MNLRSFWYIAAQSKDLQPQKVLAATILDQRLALFRGTDGRAVALEDRCLHRTAQLSKGTVANGQLACPYHGWVYDAEGRVVDVPSVCPAHMEASKRRSKPFPICEKEGYIYVWLDRESEPDREAFAIPSYGKSGYHHIRLVNLFDNTVTNCVENFVDIPHTVSVHPGIFRIRRNQKIFADVTRDQGRVSVSYRNETANLGFFSWFLNPERREIKHSDHFHMPNVTSVEYEMGRTRHFFITSQSIPIGPRQTLVYTDLTYNYGIWNRLAAPIVRQQAQTIIDQDKVILKNQNDNLLVYGEQFQNTAADLIHVYIESIRQSLEEGRDPRLLPLKQKEIEFWV